MCTTMAKRGGKGRMGIGTTPGNGSGLAKIDAAIHAAQNRALPNGFNCGERSPGKADDVTPVL
jgi:hypothetical protein